MTRLLTFAAGVTAALTLNGCCLHHGGGYGGGCNTGCGYAPQAQPYGAGFAPAAVSPGGCPDGSCGSNYGPVGMAPIPAATAMAPTYQSGATVQAGVPATAYTATAPAYGQPMPVYPASAAIDPLPTF